MSFLAKLFNKKTEGQKQPERWSLTPLEARMRAKWIVKSARKLGIELNYLPESLTVVDILIDKERETKVGLTEEMAVVLLSLGAYVGEVMVRNMKAKWVYGAEDKTHDPLLILVDEKYAINVVSMVFRRFIVGDPHSVAAMYEETIKLEEKEKE